MNKLLTSVLLELFIAIKERKMQSKGNAKLQGLVRNET